MSDIAIRLAKEDDVAEMVALINEIIRLGGTTAHQGQFTHASFTEHFLGEDNLCCYVAIDDADTIAGFQSLHSFDERSVDWTDIATFARVSPKTPGVGTALFAATSAFARNTGKVAINATIRADNTGGLAYYDKMGFETYDRQVNVPLADGTLVDRISKRFELKP